MATPIKLDTFVLRDKYLLSESQIFTEAQASAARRAEQMGWSEVSVNRTTDAVLKDGEFICYTFDVVGFNSDSKLESTESKMRLSGSDFSGLAARESGL